jgi:hypothetical protein
MSAHYLEAPQAFAYFSFTIEMSMYLIDSQLESQQGSPRTSLFSTQAEQCFTIDLGEFAASRPF